MITKMITKLTENTGMPGPRANLKGVEEFSNYVKKQEKKETLFMTLFNMWNTPSDGNDPETMLVLSGLLSLSYFHYEKDYTEKVSFVFKEAMNDERWRVREIIQESFKIIAGVDYQDMIHYFSSISNPSPLEYRAMITTIAHPELLKDDLQREYSLEMLEKSFAAYLVFETKIGVKDERVIAFQKGLSFAPSVIVAAYPKEGFEILERYIGKTKALDKIIKTNLSKNRLLKKYSESCINLENMINKNV